MIKKIFYAPSGNIYLIKDNIIIKRVLIKMETGSYNLGEKALSYWDRVLELTEEEKIEFL